MTNSRGCNDDRQQNGGCCNDAEQKGTPVIQSNEAPEGTAQSGPTWEPSSAKPSQEPPPRNQLQKVPRRAAPTHTCHGASKRRPERQEQPDATAGANKRVCGETENESGQGKCKTKERVATQQADRELVWTTRKTAMGPRRRLDAGSQSGTRWRRRTLTRRLHGNGRTRQNRTQPRHPEHYNAMAATRALEVNHLKRGGSGDTWSHKATQGGGHAPSPSPSEERK
jgi:hypothetical protein